MKTLKNWTIVCKSMKYGQKGLLNYHRYLNDQTRHTDQKINNITPNQGLHKLLQKHQDFELQNKLSNKGGRPSNPGWSAMCSYPFNLDEGQFKKLKRKVFKDFYKFVSDKNKLRLTDKMIEEQIDSTIAIIHSGENINNHLHCIFNKVFKTNPMIGSGKLVSIDLTQKKYSHMLKVINDKWCSELFNQNTVDHNIISDQKPQKRRKSGITITREKLAISSKKVKILEEALELEKMDLKTREIALQSKIDSIEEKQEILQNAMEASKTAHMKNVKDLADVNAKRALNTRVDEDLEEYRKKIMSMDKSLRKSIKHIDSYIFGKLDKHIEQLKVYKEKNQSEKYLALMNKINETMKYDDIVKIMKENDVETINVMGKAIQKK